jgi:tRNA wybutosine-synthesizing protein 3
MSFESEKQVFLDKEDRSLKGSIDGHIKGLCEKINSNDRYYTTSSCSGRIVLLKIPINGKKNETEWMFVSHDEVGEYALSSELTDLPEEDVWFRFEPLIMHIACQSVDDADRMLSSVHKAGLKRAGIISMGKRIVVEIIGNEMIEALVARSGKLLVSESYVSELVRTANLKLRKNWQNIERMK